MKLCSLLSARVWIREVGSKVTVTEYVSDPGLLVKRALPDMIVKSFPAVVCIPSSVWQECRDQ